MAASRYTQMAKAVVNHVPDKQDVFACTRCGKLMSKAQRSKECSVVKSPLWEKNSYRLPVCNECLNFLYNKYFRMLGDEYSAYRRVCMKFDLYYSDKIVDNVLKSPDIGQDRMKPYVDALKHAAYNMKTYDDTIEEEYGKYLYGDWVFEYTDENGKSVNAKVELENLKKKLTEKPVEEPTDENQEKYEKLFGLGFTIKEYTFMSDYYTTLIEDIPDSCIKSLDETLKDMCRFKILQARGIETNNVEEINKYSSLFQKSQKYKDEYIQKIKKAEAIEVESVSLASLIDQVEKFCPADIYQKKDMFADVDGIKDYMKRFIYRPLKNLFTGSRELDKEFNIDKYGGDSND